MKVKKITIKLPTGDTHIVYKYRDPEKKEISYSNNLNNVMKALFKTRYHLYKHVGLCIDTMHALKLEPDDTFEPNCQGWEEFKKYFNFSSDQQAYEFVLSGKKLQIDKDEQVYDLCSHDQKSDDR